MSTYIENNVIYLKQTAKFSEEMIMSNIKKTISKLH